MFHQKTMSSFIALSSTNLVVIRLEPVVRSVKVVHNCETLQLMVTIFLHFDRWREHLKICFLSGRTKSITVFTANTTLLNIINTIQRLQGISEYFTILFRAEHNVLSENLFMKKVSAE